MKVRAADLTWQQVDEEIVILDLASSRYLSLNGTGADLWRRLVDGASVDDLVTELVREFDISETQSQEDVRAFVASCTSLGLLE